MGLKIPTPRGILTKVTSFLGNLLTRSWWVLILILGAGGYWLKRRLNMAKLADGLKAQRDIERAADETLKNIGARTRTARAKIEVEKKQSRDTWTRKKVEIETTLKTDREGLQKLWKRAFGAKSDVRTEYREGGPSKREPQ